jgi:uncharacterized protein (DUF1330 family)
MSTTAGSIEPTPDQVQRLVGAAAEDHQPIVMINLLRFKETADGIHDGEGITGEEAYSRYAAAVAEHLQRVGGRLLLGVRAEESVIGPDATEWDMVLAVEYPSYGAFLTMTTDPGYLEIHGHRAAALSDSRLIASRPLGQ